MPRAMDDARPFIRRAVPTVAIADDRERWRPSPLPASRVTGFFDGIDVGAFQMEFDGPWPSLDAGARQDTLAFVWYPYYTSSSRFSFDEFHEMILEWKANDDPSDFFFWTDYLGGAHRTFLHALRLLDVYRGYIINGGENCPSAGTFYSAKMASGGYRLKVDNFGGCAREPAHISYDRRHGNFPIAIEVDGSNAVYYRATEAIHLCANQMDGYGRIVDLLLFWAHMGKGFATNTGDIVTGLHYLWQAQRLGRLALGAVSFISRTLLHEMMHHHFGHHCERGCCMQRIALRWQCRVFSALGLYVADEANGIDVDLLGISNRYESGCGDDGSEFVGECQMNDPGAQGIPDNWTGRSGWENPPGCP